MTEPTDRPRTKCVQCGNRTRSKYATCRACHVPEAHDHPEHEIALSGGQWRRRGAVWVWDGPRPVETPERTDELIDTLARNLTAEVIVRKKAEPTFCACGCWLISADEDCPACMARVDWLPWAQRAERRHNLTTFGRAA